MIEYRETADGLSPGKLSGFFEGWPNPPSQQTHLDILLSSAEVVVALEADQSRVVGFINAVSDGILSAYVPLLEVLPSHRNRGIGCELVRRILSRLSNFYMVDLVCDPALVTFYQKFGMSPLAGMVLRNPGYQSGRKPD